MGTRSTIALEFADGSVSQVYCHWDGYLDNNGAILQRSYMDPFKVRALMDLGDMSSLGDSLGEQHEFDCPHKFGSDEYNAWIQAKEGMCTFYKRDRKESDCDARRYMNADEYFADCQQEEYDYILRNVNGVAVWYVRCYATDGAWVTMSEAHALQERMNEMGDF